MKTRVAAAISCFLIFLVPTATYAISPQWDLYRGSGDGNTTATNWTPDSVPNGPNDVATFGLSNTTAISISSSQTTVNGITFVPGSQFFHNHGTTPNVFFNTLTLEGVGITNNSGVMQNFVITNDINSFRVGAITFKNSATAGNRPVVSIISARSWCSETLRPRHWLPSLTPA